MSWQQVAAAKRLLENERGTVHKDWGGRLPIALVFPNTYYLGMSSLAVHTLYRLWNECDDIVCERVFSDVAPPVSLESGAPLDYFPVVAFSIAYEMDYFGVVSLLRAASIPARAIERDETHPLIIAGGPAVSANPEPIAPLLDAAVIGEVEPVFTQLTNALKLCADDRDAAINSLSQIPGLYVPNVPTSEPEHGVTRQWLRDLNASPTHTVVFTADTEFSDMGLIEIARGCARGCRFCLAGHSTRPPRQRTVENILAQAKRLLRHTDRLGLVSAAVSDYSRIDELALALRGLGARISVSSMRVDPISERLIQALADSGTRTLTIAPEAGSERLRRLINKTQSLEDVLHAVELAAQHGFAQVKLYFMVGLPTEDQADIEALVDLALACSKRFTRQVTANLTPFVPKAHTPYQRLGQTPAKVVKRRLAYVERRLRGQGIGVKSESPAWAEIQGSLARGDRRMAEALLSTKRLSPAGWRKALAENGLKVQEVLRQRAAYERLPWDFVQSDIGRGWPGHCPTPRTRGGTEAPVTKPPALP
jgi:radical SAM superfamily enzyme YgiQ (UPF0313 family)